jgi:hypothetical protein
LSVLITKVIGTAHLFAISVKGNKNTMVRNGC